MQSHTRPQHAQHHPAHFSPSSSLIPNALFLPVGLALEGGAAHHKVDNGAGQRPRHNLRRQSLHVRLDPALHLLAVLALLQQIRNLNLKLLSARRRLAARRLEPSEFLQALQLNIEGGVDGELSSWARMDFVMAGKIKGDEAHPMVVHAVFPHANQKFDSAFSRHLGQGRGREGGGERRGTSTNLAV